LFDAYLFRYHAGNDAGNDRVVPPPTRTLAPAPTTTSAPSKNTVHHTRAAHH
jgi:hypothetical protein